MDSFQGSTNLNVDTFDNIDVPRRFLPAMHRRAEGPRADPRAHSAPPPSLPFRLPIALWYRSSPPYARSCS